MRDALNATGRPIWYALCGWEPFYASDPKGGTRLANSARIGPDTGSGWSAVLKNIDNLNGIGRFAGHAMAGGFWNDGSLQLAPGVGCHGGDDESTCMSRARHRSMFSLYCVHALNLVMTGNLPGIAQLDPAVMETWYSTAFVCAMCVVVVVVVIAALVSVVAARVEKGFICFALPHVLPSTLTLVHVNCVWLGVTAKRLLSTKTRRRGPQSDTAAAWMADLRSPCPCLLQASRPYQV